MLFDHQRHMPLRAEPWSESKALAMARKIFADVLARRSVNGYWPALPEEESSIPVSFTVYMGAAGTLWGLQKISQRLGEPLPFDDRELSEEIYSNYLRSPETEGVVPSLFLGESGVLVTLKHLRENETYRAKLRASIEANIRNPVNEALWGCPGTMLAALEIGEIDLFKRSADYLFEQWFEGDQGYWIWQQDLYGAFRKMIGAGHGFFGNVHPLLKGIQHLSQQQRRQLLERTVQTALGSAIRENGLANWMPNFKPDDSKKILTQWCHGAPGIITSLRDFPKNESEEMETLLLEAGELTWVAGPLAKGVGICHGTDGNGYAFLQLFERTQDQLWLDRARSFAMHAFNQRNGRSTLWTGEIGFALYLLACVDSKAGFPALDDFK